jgi:hypothetical protein
VVGIEGAVAPGPDEIVADNHAGGNSRDVLVDLDTVEPRVSDAKGLGTSFFCLLRRGS